MTKAIFTIIMAAIVACYAPEKSSSSVQSIDPIDPIWWEGKAEINTYSLSQNRYNDNHDGEVVIIFVTEPFDIKDQVKSDRKSGDQVASVLKSNQIRRFTTGIYDYSIFTSTFTGISDAITHKVTMSSQDWCGQSWLQLNQSQKKYRYEQRSYFQSEGDQEGNITAPLLEDEIMSLIRIDDTLLPVGSISILPAAHIISMKHLDMLAIPAKATRSVDDRGYRQYRIEMSSIQRTLTISYDSDENARKILGWEDKYPSAFDQKIRTTTATLSKSIWSPYWNLNVKKDSTEREKLLLHRY